MREATIRPVRLKENDDPFPARSSEFRRSSDTCQRRTLAQIASRSRRGVFNARISNENTRESYIRDAKQFASWCAGRGFTLETITAVHIAGYRDQLVKEGKRPATIKRQLSARWTETKRCRW